MNLKQTIYLSLSAVAMAIGIHRSTVDGFLESYWIIMISIIFLLLVRMNKGK